MSRIVFRADGNHEMGLGHVYRSLALAEMLKGQFELIFIIKKPTAEIKDIIAKTCDACIELPELDIKNEIEKVSGYLKKSDIVVLDGYHFTGEYQKGVKEKCHKLVSIDDLHQGHFYSDYILNHCGMLAPDIYDREPYTRLLIGEKFALLRPVFLEMARDKKDREIKNPDTLFISMGGSDYFNLTPAIVDAALSLNFFKKINVVLGAASRSVKALSDLAALNNQVEIYHNLSGSAMCEVMRESDIAVAPASSIAFEVCAVGMGFLSGICADNQRDISNWLAKTGCAEIIGDFRKANSDKIKKSLGSLLEPGAIASCVENQRIIDGLSDVRLKKIFVDL